MLRYQHPSSSYRLLVVFASFFFLNIFVTTADRRGEYPVVPWEDLWEELDEMTAGKQFCQSEDGHCWHNDTSVIRSTSSPTSVHDLHVQCHCDDDCVRYGDCCRDKAEADWGDGREEGSSRYSCRKMQAVSTIGLLMVETCLPEYEETEVETLCRQQVPPSTYSYVLDLPVTSIDTNVSYVNIHCATCNNDAANVHSWNVTINCNTRQILKDFTMAEFMEEAHYIGGMRQWQRFTYRNAEDRDRKVYQNRYYCTLEVVEFKKETDFVQNYGGRLCLFPKSTCVKSSIGRSPLCKEQIRHCDPDWPDFLDRDKCQRYSLMVSYTNDDNEQTFYKNPHCARCNFANITSSNFTCVSTNDKTLKSVGTPRRKFPPVFSVLMDFRGKRCDGRNEMWDPIHSKCQKIFCGYLYKLEGGKCIRDETVYDMLENSTLPDHTCPKISVQDYFPREDGSVFVNTSKKTYKKGEYEIINDSYILICSEYYHYTSGFSHFHKYLTVVVLIISVVALALHIVIYVLVPRVRNLPGKNLFSLTCCLFIAHMLFLTGMRATYIHGLCVFLSATLHYFWVAAFCWMNVMSVDICRTFTSQLYRGDLNTQKTYIFYSIYAWGIPALVVGLGLIFDYVDLVPDYRPEYGTELCWINSRYGLVLFYLLPVGAIVLENVVLYFVTVCFIYKQAKAASYASTRSQSMKEAQASSGGKKKKSKQDTDIKTAAQARRIRKERVRFLLYVKLGVIQGLSWVIGFLAVFINLPALWIPFTLFNGLQGAFIFLGFDMKRKIGESVWEAVTGNPWKKNQSSKAATHTSSMPQSMSSNNRSSKSYSDSDAENQLNTSVSHLGMGEGSKRSQGEVTWSSDVNPSPSSITRRKTTPLPTRSQKTSGSQMSVQNALEQILKSDDGNSTGTLVRNGDLRASVVKGKFDDEKSEDMAALSQIRVEAGPKRDVTTKLRRNKSDLQRVVDLLQQLQQSKNSGDIPDLVQQLLARSGASSDGKQWRQANLSKCLSFTEGSNPTLQEKKNAIMAKLRVQSSEIDPSVASSVLPCGMAKPSEGVSATQSLTSVNKPYRPTSLLANLADDTPAHYSSRQLLSEEEKLQRDIIRKKQKSQSFAQISQVALAATIMQRAATESRERRRGFTEVEESPNYERCQKVNSAYAKDKENPFESLV